MKIQLAVDDLAFDDAMELIDKVQNYVDIIEVGTPFIIEEGMRPVREIDKRFPNLEILADAKIMDAGAYEAEQTFKAGADYCTVLGVTDNLTIKGCLEVAKKYNKQVFVDMICVADIAKRVKELEAIGVTGLGVHTGVDQQSVGVTPLDDLKTMKKSSQKSIISVAGGINKDTVLQYKEAGADIVIVGSGITHADDPVKAAKEIHNLVRGK